MNESGLWDWLRDVALPLGKYSRIESHDTAPGFPDVHYQVGRDGCGTVELKCNMNPAKIPFPDEEKGLRITQKRWIRDTVEEGGVVWIIAEVPGVIYIIHGKDAEKFNGATHEELTEMAWGTISRDDPKGAATVLDAALRVPSNYRLHAEYY